MTQYHEPTGELSGKDRDIVRALASVKEEIEAISWYHQRAAATEDPSLRALLVHNRDEEIEHAAMAVEWLRRVMPEWNTHLRAYLFTRGDIVAIEEGDGPDAGGGGEAEEAEQRKEEPEGKGLGIGKIR